MKHFRNKKEAVRYRDKQRGSGHDSLRVWKKRKGQHNRIAKPYMVGSFIEWLNWG